MSDESQMIPKERLDAEIAKRKDAESRASSIQEQLTEALAKAASSAKEASQLKAQADGIPEMQQRLAALQTELDTTRTQGAAHTSMLEAGVSDASVRDYALHLYSKARAEAGDKAPAFGEWWKGQVEAPSTVLAPFLRPAAAPAAVAEGAAEAPAAAPVAPAGPAAVPRVEQAGARPAPATPAPWSPGAVATMSRDEFKAQKETLMKGMSIAALS